MKHRYLSFQKMHDLSSISTRRVGKTGFTLVELLVVIALISFMAAWTIMSSSDNSLTIANDAKDRILNDIVMFKKISLIEKNDHGSMTFMGSGSGFWATYPTHNNYLFTLESANQNINQSWDYATKTIYTGPNVNGANTNVNMDLDYRDTSNTIRTIISSFPFQLQTNNNIDLSFSLPQTNMNALTNLPLDQYFSLYVQDPNMPQNKSNEVAFMFLAPRNYNDTPNDDILMKLFDDHTPTANELSSAQAIFDAYGRMHWETYLPDGNPESPAPSKVSVQLFKRSDPSRILTSFDLPADY